LHTNFRASQKSSFLATLQPVNNASLAGCKAACQMQQFFFKKAYRQADANKKATFAEP
jgi:hypothetical protein